MMKIATNLFVALLLMGVSVSAQTYTANTEKTVLKWNGKKVTGEHYGKIDLKEGSFSLDNNKISGGKFVINMQSLTVEDIDGTWMEKLVAHLKSDDFFGVEDHPHSTLVLKSSSDISKGKAIVKADLTIKGITHPVEFEASVGDGKYTATVVVDRTLYNIRYGSGKFFDDLGDRAIYDDFTLDVEIYATEDTQAQVQ